jgi:ubiquinone/menaquinone biosynthesis C-methylase UbiE
VKAISNAKSDSDAQPGESEPEEVLREWRESAIYWQKHLGTIRTMFQPVTAALIEELGLIEGDAVLDVAGGSGEPSLTIAEIVGTTGSVICTDVVAEMVAAAQSEALSRGLRNVAFRQCAADSLPFESDSFDAVVSRLGVMFFPDPLAALGEMLRVTKREGAIALAVWAKSELNPFSYIVTNVISRHFETSNTPGASDGAFRFAEPGALASVLREAGANSIRERLLEFHIEALISPAGFWELRSEISGTLREKLNIMSDEQKELVAQDVKEAAREFFPNNEMRFPAQMIIVTGNKPS